MYNPLTIAVLISAVASAAVLQKRSRAHGEYCPGNDEICEGKICRHEVCLNFNPSAGQRWVGDHDAHGRHFTVAWANYEDYKKGERRIVNAEGMAMLCTKNWCGKEEPFTPKDVGKDGAGALMWSVSDGVDTS